MYDRLPMSSYVSNAYTAVSQAAVDVKDNVRSQGIAGLTALVLGTVAALSLGACEKREGLVYEFPGDVDHGSGDHDVSRGGGPPGGNDGKGSDGKGQGAGDGRE